MNKKKLTALLLAGVTALTMGLTACGDGSSSESGSKSSNSAESSKSVTEIADELRNSITFKDDLNPLEEDMYEKLYGVTADSYNSAKIYIGGGTYAEEIACFEAKDEASLETIKNAINKRIETMKQSSKDYTPEEMGKLEDPVIVTKGNCVYMCISDDNAKAKEIIG